MRRLFAIGFLVALVAVQLLVLLDGVGEIRIARAQAQSPGSVLVYPNGASLTGFLTSHPSAYSTLSRALATVPVNSLVTVPAAYRETTTTTNTIPAVAGLLIQFAAGSRFSSGASSVPVFTCAASLANVTLSGSVTLDGGYGAHGYSNNDGIVCPSSSGFTVTGMVFQNFNARGIYCSTSCTNATFSNLSFSTFGNNVVAPSGGYEAIRVDNPSHVKIDDNRSDGLTTDDFVHVFATAPFAGVGSFLEIERNHASGISRFFIETQIYGLASLVVRDNQADTFTNNAACLSINGGGAELSYDGTTPSNGPLIDGNRCVQNAGGPVLANNAIEVLSAYAKVTHNTIDGSWVDCIAIGGPYQLFEGNTCIGIFGVAVVENGSAFQNHSATIRDNKIINPRLGCVSLGARDAYGDKISGNHCERQPGYWADDYGHTSVLVTGYSILTTGICTGFPCLLLTTASTASMTTGQTWTLTGVTGTGLVSPTPITAYVYSATQFIPQGLIASGTYTIAGGANAAFAMINFFHYGHGLAASPLDWDSNEAVLTPVPPGTSFPSNFTWLAAFYEVAAVPGTIWRNNLAWNQTATAIGSGFVENTGGNFVGNTICGNRLINVPTVTNIPNTEAVFYNTCGPNQSLPPSAVPWDSGSLFNGLGTLVSSGGTVYISILAGSNHMPPNATYWQAVTSGPGASWLVTPTTFAARGFGANGSTNYCSDCTVNPDGSLAGSGAGAQFMNVNGVLVGFPAIGTGHTTTQPCAGTQVFTNGLLTAVTGTC